MTQKFVIIFVREGRKRIIVFKAKKDIGNSRNTIIINDPFQRWMIIQKCLSWNLVILCSVLFGQIRILDKMGKSTNQIYLYRTSLYLFSIVFAFDNVRFIFTYLLRKSNCKVKVFIYRSQLTKNNWKKMLWRYFWNPVLTFEFFEIVNWLVDLYYVMHMFMGY